MRQKQMPVFKDRVRLGDFLIAQGLIDEQQLEKALQYQKQNGMFLGEALVKLGFVSAETLGPHMRELTTFSFVDLSNTSINIALAHSIPEQMARQRQVLPFALEDNTVHVAMVNPLDLATVDAVRAKLNRRVVAYLTFKAELEEAINRIFTTYDKAQSILDELTDVASADLAISVDELADLAEHAPIVRLVNGIIHDAVVSSASDIHIEPHENVVHVRYRQDGVLYTHTEFPRSHLAAVVSRIKVVSHLDISERKRPQDGRFTFKNEAGARYDLRVSVLPQMHGESIVMRVIDRQTANTGLARLGMEEEAFRKYHALIRQPNGIILVTGPTGSGKSTTLYASIQEIFSSEKKIITIEDPIEYQIPGINQIQVNPHTGLTFVEGLRSIVRQDPDVIMIGEMRDRETAEIAIQAALTGHLVFSTLHTNDAPSALIRLQNMGIEPFLIASTVIGVVAQRLLRTVCPYCKELKPASVELIKALGLPIINDQLPLIAKGRGCPKCSGRGLKGRLGVYEIMCMSEPLRDLAMSRCASSKLRTQAISEGMMELREAALRLVVRGITTPDEVSRILYCDDTANLQQAA